MSAERLYLFTQEANADAQLQFLGKLSQPHEFVQQGQELLRVRDCATVQLGVDDERCERFVLCGWFGHGNEASTSRCVFVVARRQVSLGLGVGGVERGDLALATASVGVRVEREALVAITDDGPERVLG